MLQDVLSAFILHPCWTLAMKPTYQEEMIGGESLCLFSASLYAVEIATFGSGIFARRIKNILSTNNWILWVSKFEKEKEKKIRTGDKVNLYIAEMKKIREVQRFFLFTLRQPAASGKFLFLLSFQALLTGSLIAALKRL